jgi:hypothetical protein
MSIKHGLDALISLKSHLFLSQLDDYKYFIQSTEESIENRLNYLLRTYGEDKENLSYEETQELYRNLYADEFERIQYSYPFTIRQSTFLTLYSFFESELYRITINLDKENKLNEIDGNGIFKYYLFLQDGFDFTISKSLEKRFINYNALRNHFAHNNYKLNNSQFKKIKQIKGVNFEELLAYDLHLNLEETRLVETLDKELNENFLNDITEFFEILVDTLKENDKLTAVIL